jgi:allantoinase
MGRFWTGESCGVWRRDDSCGHALNAIPPTTTVEALREKVKAAQGQCWVDVGFYGALYREMQAN